MKRILLALCTLALAAAPVLAGPVYLPAAINQTDGAYAQVTELWVTNPDTAIQGFVVRYISGTANGTIRVAGDEIGPYYLAPGESKRFTNLVPAGFRGMLELDGATMLRFTGALTTRNLNGTKVAEAEVPVLDQTDIAAPGTTILLQGWERAGSTLTSSLGVVNLAHTAAQCTISIRLTDGLLAIQNVPITLQPLTQVQFDDALAVLGLTNVTEGARSEVSCDQSFWSYLTTRNNQTGEVEFIEASTRVGGSTLVEPVGTIPDPGPDPDPDPPTGDSVVFTRSGEIVRYPSSNNGLSNFRVNMPFSSNREFSQGHGRFRLPHRHLGPDQQLRLPLHLLAQQRLELEQHVRLREHPRLAQHDGLPGQRDRRRLDGAVLRRLAAAGRQLPHALRVRPRRGHRLLPRSPAPAATRSSPAPTTSAARPSPPPASSSSSATSTPPRAPRPTPRAGPSPTSGRSSSPESFRSLKQQKGRPREVALFVACRACLPSEPLAREGEAADLVAELEEGDARRRRRSAAAGWCRSCRGGCWLRGRRGRRPSRGESRRARSRAA